MFYPMTLKNLERGDQVNKLDKLMIDPCVNFTFNFTFQNFHHVCNYRGFCCRNTL